MKYAVNESASATRDLDVAVAYLADTLKSPSAAKRLLDEYEDLVSALKKMPFVHPLVRDDLLAFCGYRWAKASSYLVFFTVNENAATVDIHRIAHESRNWMQLLR